MVLDIDLQGNGEMFLILEIQPITWYVAIYNFEITVDNTGHINAYINGELVG